MFDRGQTESVPIDHAIECPNSEFEQDLIKTRKGFEVSLTISSVVRAYVYKRVGEVSRLIILDNTGKFFDSTDLVNPILNIPAATDFSMLVLYNRAYITPHNGTKGLPGEFLYVYDGSVARKAAGTLPSSFTLGAATSATSGKVEAGLHLFAVAYETESGFISRPGPEIFAQYTAPGSYKVDISNIPTGPTGTAYVWILATQVIETYDGNQENWEMFFVPNGRVVNGTSTLTVDFYDTDLVSTADYLLDELDEIPATVGLSEYQGRLVAWTEDDQNSIIRVSKAGEPESVSEIDGYILARPGEGGEVTNVEEFRGLLYILKGNKFYVTQNNGYEPNTWVVTDIDNGIGTGVHGIATILDTQGNTKDQLIFASYSGLQLFNGTLADKELSWKIHDVWKRININYFKYVQVVVDSVNEKVYVTVPLDSATAPSHILYGDYQDGLDADNIKWSIWSVPNAPTCILVDTSTSTGFPVFKFGSTVGNIYIFNKTRTNDYNTTIAWSLKTTYASSDESGIILHFSGIRLRCWGAGNLGVIAYSLDDALSFIAPSITLSASPGREFSRLIDIQNEKCSIYLSLNSADKYISLRKISLFARPLWNSRPE